MIIKNHLYLLQKLEVNSHYLGLKELLVQNEIHLKYREFSVSGKMDIFKIDHLFFLRDESLLSTK